MQLHSLFLKNKRKINYVTMLFFLFCFIGTTIILKKRILGKVILNFTHNLEYLNNLRAEHWLFILVMGLLCIFTCFSIILESPLCKVTNINSWYLSLIYFFVIAYMLVILSIAFFEQKANASIFLSFAHIDFLKVVWEPNVLEQLFFQKCKELSYYPATSERDFILQQSKTPEQLVTNLGICYEKYLLKLEEKNLNFFSRVSRRLAEGFTKKPNQIFYSEDN